MYGIIRVDEFASKGDTVTLRLSYGGGPGDIEELIDAIAERLSMRGLDASLDRIEECVRKVLSDHGQDILRRLIGELGEGGLESIECVDGACTATIDVGNAVHGDVLLSAADEEDMDSLIEEVWWELETADAFVELVLKCLEEGGW